MILRALTYILRHGDDGIKEISSDAVLAANYVLARLKRHLRNRQRQRLQARVRAEFGQLQNRLRRDGARCRQAFAGLRFHAPTMYFPTIVKESLMIEPTETETKATLDEFCDAMIAIAQEARTDAHLLHHAPHTLSVGRMDEANAARCLNLCWIQEAL